MLPHEYRNLVARLDLLQQWVVYLAEQNDIIGEQLDVIARAVGSPATKAEVELLAKKLRASTATLAAAVRDNEQPPRGGSSSEAGTSSASPSLSKERTSPMASPLLETVQKQVAETTTVIESAVALIRGISAQIDGAVAKVLANGATAAQLQPLADLSTAMSTQAQSLAQAVAENTPAV